MSISCRILGKPGEDNAAHVVVDTGQSQHALLFDCGESCAAQLRVSQCQAIEHLCFSHFHMDHVAGFDTFFRHNYNRPDRCVNVWGPQQAIDVMHHRFRGFSWNLHHHQPGEWKVHEILESEIASACFLTREAYATAHENTRCRRDGCRLLAADAFVLEARILNHGTTPSIGYRIVEPERRNIDPAQLSALGLRPGPWLATVTDLTIEACEWLTVDEQKFRVGDLRERLIVTRAGESFAYLTDFALTTQDRDSVVEWLKGTDTLVCEAQYLHRDVNLARDHFHMTTRSVGELARDADVGKLVLQHLSRRYSPTEWKAGLAEARSVFPNARFPEHWSLEA